MRNTLTRCPFCDRPMPPVPEAIDRGWIPSYFVGCAEHDDPVCPGCAVEHLRHAPDGEWELIEEGKV